MCYDDCKIGGVCMIKNNKIIIIILVSAIIIVMGGGYIVYKNSSLKNNYTEASKDDDLNNTDSNNNKNTNSNVTTSYNQEEILALGNKLWLYAYETFWGYNPVKNNSGEICKTSSEEVRKKYTTDAKISALPSEDGSNEYIITTDKYIEYFKKMCDGSGGRGGDQSYKDTTLTISDVQEDKITFIATSSYCDSSFCQSSNETVKERKRNFVIKKENGNWLIDEFYLPN